MRRIALVLALLTVAFGIAISLVSSPGSPSAPTEPSKEYRRPSGFWTSTRPATNGAYRYRLLGIGIALIGATGTVMVLLVNRANVARGTGAKR